MSLTYDYLDSVVQDYIESGAAANNIFGGSPLLDRLWKKAKPWKGGQNYQARILSSANSNTGAVSKSGTLGTTVDDEATLATFVPKVYYAQISVYGLDLALANSEDAAIDMLEDKFNIAVASLKDDFATDIVGDTADITLGTYANKLVGLTHVCGDATYGGIATSDLATWASTTVATRAGGGPDTATTALTGDKLATLYEQVTIDGDEPTVIITTPTIKAQIAAEIALPLQRFQVGDDGKLGFNKLFYRNAEIVADSHVASGDLFMLNENHLYMAVLTPDGRSMTSIKKKGGFFTKAMDNAVTNDVWVKRIFWYGALVCDSRWSQAWLSAISSVTA